MSDAIEPHAMRHMGDSAGSETALFGTHLGIVSLWFLEYGMPVEIRSPGAASCFCIQFPLTGSVQVSCGGEEIAAGADLAAVPAPSRPLFMRWTEPSPHLIIRVDREPVEGALRGYLGTGDEKPILTNLGLDLSGEAGIRWRSILQLLLAEIGAGEGTPFRETRTAALHDLVISSLLLSHPNSQWEALHTYQSPAGSPYVRRAIDYVRANLFGPLTTALIAHEVGISVRALQAGFAREVGCTPTAYVREQRLSWVRERLLGTEPDSEVTVTEIALHGGFPHLGRFSQLYKRRFGESPSDTLCRTRIRT